MRLPRHAIAVGLGLACAVAFVARMRQGALRTFLVLLRALVATAATTAAPASAPTSAAGPLLSAALMRKGGLLAQSGWDVDGRLIRELFARLRRLNALPCL